MDFAQTMFQNFAGKVAELLPKSPTIDNSWFELARDYMGILNWFFPVGLCLDFLVSCLGLLAIYYAAVVILRWIKVIS